ncbi:hypothetical protein N8T08_003973 [Aspergillus melleus]|uniref:Uncharacterized protein n=1 Tax=Aspergillus melleus TaxID=138277 RepID=A0ACC3B620_9EURO|nr:hypothetical protein N8T08_003973 [Aspergillus melleus]
MAPDDSAALRPEPHILQPERPLDMLAKLNKYTAVEEGSGEDTESESSNDEDTGTHSGGNPFATKFHGDTHVSTILKQIPGLYHFTREAFEQFPAMDQVRHAVHKSETWDHTAKPVSTRELYALLPPRSEADNLVSIYFESFEPIYHIFHRPNFRQSYGGLWERTDDSPHQFIVVALLIIAAAMCLISTHPSPDSTEIECSRDTATRIIQSCEDVLQSNPLRYNRLLDFQVAFLLLLARQVNGRRYKQTWPNAGKLVQISMSVGLHREKMGLGKRMSDVDKELRRRIWASVAEFELQASFERGMPPVLWTQQCNIRPPRNIADDDLELPPDSTKSSDSLNPSWYLSTLSSSLTFRHSLAALLNDSLTTIPFSNFKSITEKLIHYLSVLLSSKMSKTQPVFGLLMINLHQYQLALHFRQASRSPSSVERDFSRMVMWRTATEIIDIHEKVLSGGSHILELLGGDHFRAALSLSYVFVSHEAVKAVTYFQPSDEDYFDFTRKAIDMITTKTLRFSGDQRQLWITMASNAFVESLRDPPKRNQYLKKAVDQFLAVFNAKDSIPVSADLQSSVTNNSISTEVAMFMQSPTDLTISHEPSHDELGLMDWWFGNDNLDDLASFIDFN